MDTGAAAIGNYTTSEVATGYTWIDGKTIYKLTTTFAVTGSSSEQAVNGVMSAAATLPIKFEGGIKTSTDFWGWEYVNPLVSTIQNAQAKLQLNAGVWRIAYFAGGSGTAYITVYYVK